jgi:hypothetical protein
MAEISISQMDTITNPSGGDLIEVAAPDIGSASGYTTGKESLSAVANLVATGTSFAGLNTTDDTLVGAINEVNSLGDSISDAYDDTETYNTGDFCIHENTLYQCNSDNITGAWDSQYWDAVKITDVIGSSGGGTKVNFGTTSYVNVTEAYYIECPDYYFICVNVTAAQNIPASTAILTDGPALTNAQNVTIIRAGNGIFYVEPAVFGTSTNFILRNVANNGDLIAFSGLIAK